MSINNITKASKDILLGFVGIVYQRDLPLRTKIMLFLDDLRCINLLFLSKLTGKNVSTFRIISFDYTIHFTNLSAFYFVFNEIFCKAIYSKNLNSQLVFDCGSNIGMFILWVRHFNKQCKFVAFEPAEKTFKILSKNIEVNNIGNCEIHKIALSNFQGTSDFYNIKDEIQVLNSGLNLDQELPFSKEIVKTDHLSNYVRKQAIDFLKLDIEGSEYEVIEELSSSAKISLFREMIVEIHFPQKHNEKYKKMLNILKLSGKIVIYKNSINTEVLIYEKR